MKIPLPGLMRKWRESDFALGGGSRPARWALRMWAWMAKRPQLYHLAARLGMPVLAALAGRRGAFRSLPLASAWTRHRDLPAPQGRTFQQLWAQRKGTQAR